MNRPIALEERRRMGARLSSPSAGRNREVIAGALCELLPKRARVLEVAAGTGEHAATILPMRGDVFWQPTDPDARSRESQDAWSEEAGWRMLPSLSLDTRQPEWWRYMPQYDAVFCANMIHIAPWSAAVGLAGGAGYLLKPGGRVVLYGPFLKGEASADGNLAFDASLRRRDAEWGVREIADVKQLFATHGLDWIRTLAMPANNDIVVFTKRSTQGRA